MSDNLLGLGGDNFDQSNAGILPRFSKVDIDTTQALVNLEFDTSGFNFVWVAPDPYVRTAGGGFDPTLIDAAASVGRAHAQFGDTVAPAVPLKRGFVYSLPATRILYITCPAQALTMMRLYFSTGPRVLPFSADVNLSGGVSLTAGSLVGLASALTSGVARVGASSTVLAATGVTTCVAPGANVNGIWLRTFAADSQNASWFAVYADTAAPAAYGDNTKRAIYSHGMPSGAQPWVGSAFQSIFIPAGVGLYLAASCAGTGFGRITYDIL